MSFSKKSSEHTGMIDGLIQPCVYRRCKTTKPTLLIVNAGEKLLSRPTGVS